MPDIIKEHNAVLDARKEYHKFIRKYSEKRIKRSLTFLRWMDTLERNLVRGINNLDKIKGGEKGGLNTKRKTD